MCDSLSLVVSIGFSFYLGHSDYLLAINASSAEGFLTASYPRDSQGSPFPSNLNDYSSISHALLLHLLLNGQITTKRKFPKIQTFYLSTPSKWRGGQSLVSYLGLDAISPPVHFLHSIRLEYGSHLWRGASKHSLATLDAIQKRAIKLIGDPALTNSLDFLAHRRTISALSLYYRNYHGVCSVELKSIIPSKALFA